MRPELRRGSVLAAAFFSARRPLQWGDQRLLDDPHITRQMRSGRLRGDLQMFSVAEKLFLLRKQQCDQRDAGG